MKSQQHTDYTTLPTGITQRRFDDPAVRFGEGHISPKVAMHHAKEMKLPATISMPRNGAEPTVRFGEGHIAPKVAMHHSKELK